jgi:hypothetical protein
MRRPVSQAAADKGCVDTASKLPAGLSQTMRSYDNAADVRRQQIFGLWTESQ